MLPARFASIRFLVAQNGSFAYARRLFATIEQVQADVCIVAGKNVLLMCCMLSLTL